MSKQQIIVSTIINEQQIKKAKEAEHNRKSYLKRQEFIKNNPELFPKGLCHCGCGGETEVNNRTGKPNKFINHHWARMAPVGKDSPNWKNDNLAYITIHVRIGKLLPKPDRCSGPCNRSNIRLTLASIGHTYTLNPKDWMWLCDLCHSEIDGRKGKTHASYGKPRPKETREKISLANRIDMDNRVCHICGSDKTAMIKKESGLIRPAWFNLVKGVNNGNLLCCYQYYLFLPFLFI